MRADIRIREVISVVLLLAEYIKRKVKRGDFRFCALYSRHEI